MKVQLGTRATSSAALGISFLPKCASLVAKSRGRVAGTGALLLLLAVVTWLYPKLTSNTTRSRQVNVPDAANVSSGGQHANFISQNGNADGFDRGKPNDTRHSAQDAGILSEALQYFTKVAPRVEQVLSDTLPSALASRRRSAGNFDEVIAVVRTLRSSFAEAHKNTNQRYVSLPADVREQIRRQAALEMKLDLVTFYARALSDQTPAAGSTVAAITRDVLTNTEQFDLVKRALAETERTEMNNEASAQRIDAAKTGQEMIDIIIALEPRYSLELQRLSERLPIDPTIKAYREELHYLNGLWETAKAYKHSWSEDVESASQEIESIQRTMYSYIQALPNDEPERAHLASQLSDILSRLEQIRRNDRNHTQPKK